MRVLASLMMRLLLLWWMLGSWVWLRRVALMLVQLAVRPRVRAERNHLWAVVGRTIEVRANWCAAALIRRLKLFAMRHRGRTCILVGTQRPACWV